MRATHRLLMATLLAVILGVGAGWFFGETMQGVAWIGTLFLNLLKMLILPMVMASVIRIVAEMGLKGDFSSVGLSTLFYYACTTALAVGIGLLVVNIIQPGVGANLALASAAETSQNFAEKAASLPDLVLSLTTPNLAESAVNMQILPLLVFSIMLGVAIAKVGKAAQPVHAFFAGLAETMLTIVQWVMFIAPLGIFALISSRLGQAGGGEAFFSQISAVGLYVLTVLVGLGLHAVVLMVILALWGRRLWRYIGHISPALITAFGTSSSSAALPTTMACVAKSGVSDKSSRFVLPLGATVNMDGTALYEAVAVMFIAQAYGIELGLGAQAVIFLTATMAAVGAAGIPEAGLVMMVIVLSAVGLPLEGIGLILAVDWFLDRCRTTINVFGDSVGAAVIDRRFSTRTKAK